MVGRFKEQKDGGRFVDLKNGKAEEGKLEGTGATAVRSPGSLRGDGRGPRQLDLCPQRWMKGPGNRGDGWRAVASCLRMVAIDIAHAGRGDVGEQTGHR